MRWRSRSAGLTDARTFVSQSPTIAVGRRRGLPVQFVIQAANMEKLTEVLPPFLAAARADPTFTFVDVNLKFDKPELRVTIDRERAQDLGISALRIAQTLQLALSEQRLGYFVMDGKQYEVIGQVMRAQPRRNRRSSQPLRHRPGQAAGDARQAGEGHRDQHAAADLSFRPLRVGHRVGRSGAREDHRRRYRGDADGLRSRFSTTPFPRRWPASRETSPRAATSLVFVFVLALVLVYLVLAAQFESFRDPLIIMFTVPLALAGALLSLWYFNQTINIFSQIGMIMLIGLVTKNGILIVEFANQRKAAGSSVTEAIIEGATARFRPVLMTSLSTVLGILPIALGARRRRRKPHADGSCGDRRPRGRHAF